VAYPGTHDNDTTVGWWRSLPAAARARYASYVGAASPLEARRTLAHSMVQATLQSPARTAIVAMQDHLGLDRSARMNVPGKGSNQWRWRMAPDALRGLDATTMRHSVFATARV
jgi:4-alpha-glucanotransferase